MSDWEYTDIYRFMGRLCGGPEITLRQAVEGDISDEERAASDARVAEALRKQDEANATMWEWLQEPTLYTEEQWIQLAELGKKWKRQRDGQAWISTGE